MNHIRNIFVAVVVCCLMNICTACVDDKDMDSLPDCPIYIPGEDGQSYPQANYGTLDELSTTYLKIASGTSKYLGSRIVDNNGNPFNKDVFMNAPGNMGASEGPIEFAVDGLENNKIFHTPYPCGEKDGLNFLPVELEFTLEGVPSQVDFIRAIPRNGSGNGVVKDMELFVQCEGKEYVSYGRKKVGGGVIEFKVVGLEKPRKFKFVVYDGASGFVSLSEVRCIQISSDYDKYVDYFEDKLCTIIKPSYMRADLEQIDNLFFRNMALAVFDKQYDVINRVINVKSYPDPDIKARENFASPYGLLDNATGIYAEWKERIVVFVEGATTDMTLRLVNPMKSFNPIQEVPLYNGINILTAKEKGLMYIIYQSSDDLQAKVNIVGGKVNGVFDLSRHNASQWLEILNKSSFTHIDLLGAYTHLIFTTADLKAYTNDAVKLLGVYDDVAYKMQDFMGLNKYTNQRGEKRLNKNRICMIGMNITGFMYATSYYTAGNLGTMVELCDMKPITSNALWGIAHEFAHVNQVRPGFKWGAYGVKGDLTEISNNVCTMYIKREFKNKSYLIQDGYYDKAFNLFFTRGWRYDEDMEGANAFERLVPMWQLQLYFADAKDNVDFYKDLYEKIRLFDYSLHTDASKNVRFCMDKFVEHVSDVAQTDVVDFFNAWGFDVSASMVKTISTKGYPKNNPSMRYITDDNIALFKNNAVVTSGSVTIKVIKPDDVTIFVNDDCQNAVVYEVYESTNKVRPKVISQGRKISFTSVADSFVIKAIGADGSSVVLTQ